MIIRPYIGVTGVTTRQQAITLCRQMPKVCKFDLMIGVLASNKTLSGEADLFPNQTPDRLAIAKIFAARNGLLNLLHYYTNDRSGLFHQLAHAFALAGKNCGGLQLNMPWPDPEVIKKFRRLYPAARVVVQINREALAEFDGDLQACVTEAEKYNKVATDLLFDLSGGEGRPIDTDLAWKFFKSFHGSCNLVIAGGLDAESLPNLQTFFRTFSSISIDAQGKLRTSSDHLDLRKAKKYLQKALALLHS